MTPGRKFFPWRIFSGAARAGIDVVPGVPALGVANLPAPVNEGERRHEQENRDPERCELPKHVFSLAAGGFSGFWRRKSLRGHRFPRILDEGAELVRAGASSPCGRSVVSLADHRCRTALMGADALRARLFLHARNRPPWTPVGRQAYERKTTPGRGGTSERDRGFEEAPSPDSGLGAAHRLHRNRGTAGIHRGKGTTGISRGSIAFQWFRASCWRHVRTSGACPRHGPRRRPWRTWAGPPRPCERPARTGSRKSRTPAAQSPLRFAYTYPPNVRPYDMASSEKEYGSVSLLPLMRRALEASSLPETLWFLPANPGPTKGHGRETEGGQAFSRSSGFGLKESDGGEGPIERSDEAGTDMGRHWRDILPRAYGRVLPLG